MLLVAPWSVRCAEWISTMAGLPDLLRLASESGELKIDESGGSRDPYVVKIFIYSTLPAQNIIARFKKNTPVFLERTTQYAMYLLFDPPQMLKGMAGFGSVHLGNLPEEKRPFWKEVCILVEFIAFRCGEHKKKRSTYAALERLVNWRPLSGVCGKRLVVLPVSEWMAKRPRGDGTWPRFAGLLSPSEETITLGPLRPGLQCQAEPTLIAMELFQKAYAQLIAQEVREMKIQNFVSGVQRPETRKNPADTRLYIGTHSNPADTLRSWKHAVAMVWGRDVFLDAVKKQDYGKLAIIASNHVVTSHGGCGAQVAVEPKFSTAGNVENVVTSLLSMDYRLQNNQGATSSHVVIAMTTSFHEAYFTYESLRAAARELAQCQDVSLTALPAVSKLFCDILVEKDLPVLRAVLGLECRLGETRQFL